jgi:hypothetical protein
MLSRLRRVNFAPDAMFDLLVVPAGSGCTVVSGHRDGRAARVQGVPGGLYIDEILGSSIGRRIAIANGGGQSAARVHVAHCLRGPFTTM